MKKKYLLLGLLCITVMLLVGCSTSKTVISTNQFIEKATSNGYTTKDAKDQFSSYDQILEATIIDKADNFKVEFYVLNSTDDAKSMYETNKEIFEDSKEGTSTNTTTTIGNYADYTLVTGGKYKHLCRVDNTLLYVNVDTTYQEEVIKFIDSLGY